MSLFLLMPSLFLPHFFRSSPVHLFHTYDAMFTNTSALGHALVREMNRLGMLVDISHTSDFTALQVLSISRAPVIWSHSSARAVWDVARNIPDFVLEKVGEGEGKKDAVIMVSAISGYC